MRLEATIPETRREQLRTLQAKLKLTKSQVVDEARTKSTGPDISQGLTFS